MLETWEPKPPTDPLTCRLASHHRPDRPHHGLPALMVRRQLLLALLRDLVELRTLPAFGHFPLGLDPLLPLQPVQRRIQGSSLHLQYFIGLEADGLGDAVSVHRPPLQ